MKVLTFSQQCHVCPSSNQFDPPPLQDCEKFGAERAEKRFQCEVTEPLFKVWQLFLQYPFEVCLKPMEGREMQRFEYDVEVSSFPTFEYCFCNIFWNMLKTNKNRREGERFECDAEAISFPGWLSWKPAHRRSLTTRFFGTSYFDFARFWILMWNYFSRYDPPSYKATRPIKCNQFIKQTGHCFHTFWSSEYM